MKIIKEIIQNFKNDFDKEMVKPLGHSVENLYDLMDKNPSLISTVKEINPSLLSINKVDNGIKTFVLKVKVENEIFQINFRCFKDYDIEGILEYYELASISILNSPHIVKISDNLVPQFLKKLDVKNLVKKSTADLHKLKETQDLEILNKIKVRP